MAAANCIIVLCTLHYLCFVTCQLNLKEGSHCVTNGWNGTCVGIFRCDKAKLMRLNKIASFEVALKKNSSLKVFDICSYKNKLPVVCCPTNWNLHKTTYRATIVGQHGRPVKKAPGAIAKEKCYEYSRTLPYRCNNTLDENQKDNKDDIRLARQAEGGRDVLRWELPHMALIGYGTDVNTAQWLCGGSVISNRFILTAAHCKSTSTSGNITFAALGIVKRTDPKDKWKIYKIKRIIVHPKYMSPSMYHDIALLETEKEIRFSKNVLPVCLDLGMKSIAYAEASGWGSLGRKQPLADTLQAVKLEEFNKSECSKIHKPHRHLLNGYDHEKQMCFGHHNKTAATCEGDSGGPLQVNMDKCRLTVVGVTSFGNDCGILGSAGMYTRVSYYIHWIESIVWPEETEEFKENNG